MFFLKPMNELHITEYRFWFRRKKTATRNPKRVTQPTPAAQDNLKLFKHRNAAVTHTKGIANPSDEETEPQIPHGGAVSC